MPPALNACLRLAVCMAAAWALLAAANAHAQAGTGSGAGAFKYRWSGSVPADEITPGDIVLALMWTGHYGLGLADKAPTDVGQATRAWQASKGHKPTETLPDEQVRELVGDGLSKRDAAGWATLKDSAIGFEVGIPAKLVKRSSPQTQHDALLYSAEGEVSHHVVVHYGNPSCLDIDAYMKRVAGRAAARVRLDDGFLYMKRTPEGVVVGRAACHLSGMVTAVISMPPSMVASHGALFNVLAGSLRVAGNFNATARPRPKVVEPPFATMGLPDESPFHPAAATARPANVDGSGQAQGLRLETKNAPDLRTDEVFEKVAGAVYMVKADKSQGSAVAVAENLLLTNCHVVGERTQVTLVREKQDMKADVVSAHPETDRCVLKVDAKLPTWVAIRPFNDIKVGEHAVTVGTPFGLELTAADGIVSSKRPYQGSKLVQTSAPISPGSSGGGLFDARGNLIGITTFYVKVGQNLNFAIAAEEFVGTESPTR